MLGLKADATASSGPIPVRWRVAEISAASQSDLSNREYSTPTPGLLAASAILPSVKPATNRDVSLSHSSVDKPRVRRLAFGLRDRGVRVWFDETEIPAGGSIPLAVEDGVERSRVMVLCLSPAFLQSEWAQAERSAMQFADPANRNRTLIPLLFKACELPKALAHLKYVDYRRHSEKVVDQLAVSLGAMASSSIAPPHPVEVMVDEANERQREGSYVAAAEITLKALDLAGQEGTGSPDGAHWLARARVAHSHALLLCDRDFETAWELADAGADPSALDGCHCRLGQSRRPNCLVHRRRAGRVVICARSVDRGPRTRGDGRLRRAVRSAPSSAGSDLITSGGATCVGAARRIGAGRIFVKPGIGARGARMPWPGRLRSTR
jgi:hypothetical protein